MNLYKHKKENKQIIESIKVIEYKIETVNNKINNTKKEIHKPSNFARRKKITNKERNIFRSTKTVLIKNLDVLNV